MSSKPSQHSVYSIRGLPAGVWGESYVVVTAYESTPNELAGEFFIMTKLPQEALNSGALKITVSALPKELGVIDLEFALKESLRQTEISLMDQLESRAAELGRPDVAYLQFELKPTTTSDLLRCWMNERFKPQLIDIQAKTQCRSLKQYLGFFSQVGPIVRVGWDAI